MALSLSIAYECQSGGGAAHLVSIFGGSGSYSYRLERASDGVAPYSGGVLASQLAQNPLDFDGLFDDAYTLTVVDEADPTNQGSESFNLTCGYANPNPGGGGGGPSPVALDSLTSTDETAAGDDGTATIQASGGVAPLTAEVVELSLTAPATSGQPAVLTGLPPSTYTVRVRDSSTPPQVVGGKVTIKPYVAPKSGCMDEYATDYDPAATTAGACSYAPLWRSAWGPSGMAVPVPALAGQVEAYTVAELRIGFRAGHPLAAVRSLGLPLRLRATVGPQGFAVFRLGQYLRSALGASDGAGGYRLDLNEQTVDDFYVGYELRRTTGELLEHGYAVNAAVPDAQLAEGTVLSAFDQVPTWPGFDWKRARLASRSTGKYGAMDEVYPSMVRLLCPPNPLPVAWLNPQGGFDFWVFQGRPQLGDDVGESQGYTEAATGESRWSQRGAARGTITASSGIFNGPQFAEGLRTLWASPQVWYQPVANGPWVPVTLGGGQFPVRRMGLARTEVTLTFTEARPHYAQGQ